jgi:hypothetical protein
MLIEGYEMRTLRCEVPPMRMMANDSCAIVSGYATAGADSPHGFAYAFHTAYRNLT